MAHRKPPGQEPGHGPGHPVPPSPSPSPCAPEELIPAILQAHGKDARILGLDLGRRTIGLALSDVRRSMAGPLETIRRTRLANDLERIRTLVVREGIGGFVLGLPLNMDGSEGPRCQATRQFAADLGRAVPLPLTFWDERLSSFEADQRMQGARLGPHRRLERIDRLAAQVILQDFLDHVSRQTWKEDEERPTEPRNTV